MTEVRFARSAAALLVSAGLALASASAGAASFSKLVVFGDSLSDSGNASVLVGTNGSQPINNSYIPGQAYPSFNFSNGPVWAQQYAALMGLPLTASLTGGTNFAFGGAQVNTGDIPSLTAQFALHAFGSGLSLDPQALYVVAGGGNDARRIAQTFAGSLDPADIFSGADTFAKDVHAIVDGLQSFGAKHIVVWNVPNVGAAPAAAAAGPAAVAVGSFISAVMNSALDIELAGETGVLTFRLDELLGKIIASPLAYGFDNTTDACGNPDGLVDCNTALFYDGLHPTAYAHGLIALDMQRVTAAIPEPGTWGLMALGLLAVGAAARRQSRSA